jgi:feruloyl esterase
MRNTPIAVLPGAILLALVVAAPATAQDTRITRVAVTNCAAVAALALPDVRITAASAVAPGERISVPHCKVSGVIGREIRFELLLPDSWNERFVMGGGGGFVGAIDNQALGSINAGYATVATDTGHRGDGMDATWALDNLERQVNFGHLAVHRTAVVARAIAQGYYGSAPRYSYFVGCSNGGRQGLMEAQRYPDDFDGIVSGAPALNFTNIAVSFVKNMQALYPNPSATGAGIVSPDNLTLVASTVMDACDASDQVKDGVIDDPRVCRVDVSTLPVCANDVAAAGCVTAAQRTAIARIYAPLVVNGVTVYPGQPPGGEAETGGWRSWITGPMSPNPAAPPSAQWAFGTQFFKHFVFSDPAWSYVGYDFSTWARDTKQAGSMLNADSPDLSAFTTRRGKLLLWHGWSDAALNALETIRYYDRVVQRDPAMAASVRLFMLPGVQHCGGGAGADAVDWLAALRAWVEGGEAPTRLIATKRARGAAVRTRPVCTYPQRAVYVGTGSTDAAESFTCRPPR